MTSGAIVGAGPAGCAAAIALARRGCDVALLGDRTDAVGEQLAPSARPLLQRLGLLPLDGHLDCVGVRTAWHSAELQAQDFLFHPFGPGWLLDRARFGEQMRRAAAAAGASLHEPARLLHLERDTRWHLSLAGGAQVECQWLVDASGRRAVVAGLLGIGRQHVDAQVAVVGRLATAEPDEDATLTVETVDDDWWYTCRVPGDARIAARITRHPPNLETWEPRLRATRHIAALVRGYRRCGEPIVRPAGSSILERICGDGWMAIGDAAASFDPLASRGLVRALESGIEVGDLIGASPARLAEHDHAVRVEFARYLDERRKYA